MWTCGIDMATQQATPAMQSSTISVLGEIPSEASATAAGPPVRRTLLHGRAAAHQHHQRQDVLTRQKHADRDMRGAPAVGGDEMLHDRRPDRAARDNCPHDASATAMPRRRTNQCEMSVISGPNVAELPNPMSALRQRELPWVGRRRPTAT